MRHTADSVNQVSNTMLKFKACCTCEHKRVPHTIRQWHVCGGPANMATEEDTGGRTVRPKPSLASSAASAYMLTRTDVHVSCWREENAEDHTWWRSQVCSVACSLCVDSMAVRHDVLHAPLGFPRLQLAGINLPDAPQTDPNALQKSAVDTKAVRTCGFDGAPSSWEVWAHS